MECDCVVLLTGDALRTRDFSRRVGMSRLGVPSSPTNLSTFPTQNWKTCQTGFYFPRGANGGEQLALRRLEQIAIDCESLCASESQEAALEAC